MALVNEHTNDLRMTKFVPRLDLGQVQDIIDDCERTIRQIASNVQHLPLLLG